MRRDRSGDPREYFMRFHDLEDNITQEYNDKGMTLLMSIAKEPVDIIWSNMGGTRGVYF